MRNLAIDRAHEGARVRASSWCSAIAVALAILPGSAWARVAPPEPAPPTSDQFEPVPIQATPLPEPPPPPPPPEPPPPTETVAPVEGSTPAQVAQVQMMRKASLGLMTTGGVVATAGLGMTIAFTVLGHQAQNAEVPAAEDIEHEDAMARVGGVLLASGIAVVAIGGIIFVSAKKKAESRTTARVRVAPAIGGVVVSGRF